MSLTDIVNKIEEDEYSRARIEEFLKSLLPENKELHYTYYEDFYTIGYAPSEERLPKIKEAVSLIPSDKWQETKPVFYKNEVKQSDGSFYYKSIYHFKVKAPNNKIYLISWEGRIYNHKQLKYSIFKPLKKQAEKAFDKNINEILDRIKQNLYGSQRFVKNHHFILFDDGIIFSRGFGGSSSESEYEHNLARLVIDIKNS